MKICRFLLAFAFVVPLISKAQSKSDSDLDSASKEALEKTTELLKNKKLREESMAGDAKAQKADQYLNNLMGSEELSEEVYSLIAEVFPLLVKEANGDVSKMEEMLRNFSKNPGSFAAKWTPDQREKLLKLSEKMSANQIPR